MAERKTRSIEELAARVAELERQLEEHVNHEPSTWQEEYLREVPMRVVKVLLMHLETISPGIGAAVRRAVETLEYRPIDEVLAKHPEMEPVADWQRARAKEIIDEMLPCSGEP